MSFDGASMAYEMLQKPLFFVMQKLLKPVSRRASLSLDGASMAYAMLPKPFFYYAKPAEACIEAGLNDPRWSLDGI